MSRQLPEKPNLKHLKETSQRTLRTMPQGNWPMLNTRLPTSTASPDGVDLKAHVDAHALTPAQALKAAVCDQDAAHVRPILTQHPDLRTKIDAPLPDYGLARTHSTRRCSGLIVLRLMCCWSSAPTSTSAPSGGLAVRRLDDCDPGLAEFLTERGALSDRRARGITPRDDTRVEVCWRPIRAWSTHAAETVRTPLHWASTN